MDALSEVLASVRLKGTGWACTAAKAPWGLSLREAKGKVRFHYVARGRCWLSVDKSPEPPSAMSGGDLAVIPLGHGHTLKDQPRSPATKVEDFAGGGRPTLGGGVMHLRIGGTGPETMIVSGAFEVEDPSEAPVLATLPSLIRITPDRGEAVPSFAQNLQFISREVDSNRSGSQIVLTRMADVLFVQVLRAYIESLPDGSEGILGALRDTNMSAALGLMHRQPEEQWTVASLADKVGLSRSAFAARFTQLVGEPPLGYLTRLRMRKAARLLRNGATLAKVSQETGYSSEVAFSHAFRLWAGIAPGAYRRQMRDAASSAE